MNEKKSPIDEKQARALLERERKRVESALADAARLRESAIDEVDTEINQADDGEMIEERGVDDAVVRSLRYELEAIERAEKRLEDGTYGLSVESGEPIPAQRLESVPWAERTTSEQESYERTHGRPW